ncbi:MAG: DUF4861 domain-containing protein [Prevotellaceae bacterium]|jgi:hypothetical protein|nr:DUF4861 domain-containing protein [Prevotellaceae bacterium]
MKKTFILIFASLLLFSCGKYSKTITVTNVLDFDRTAELVEVKIADLNADFTSKSYILKNDKGEEVAYQISENGATLLFQADVAADSFAVYTLTIGKPSEVAPKTDAFFVPERRDDFAWENDIAAYRMYGPDLADENPSNGVDLWLKKTDKPIMRQFYDDEHLNGKPYHIDHGEGLDCYKVAHTLGAGGVAPYIDGTLYVGDHYSSYNIIEKGALRSAFSLTYDSVKIGEDIYNEEITITTSAGSLLNKAVVRYNGARDSIKLAVGIFLHNFQTVNGVIMGDDDKNFIAYAEDATGEMDNLPVGRNYVGVVSKEKSQILIPLDNKQLLNDSHLLRIADYKTGDEFTYYFGGGWSQWKFATDADWQQAMENFSQTIHNPLEITVE